MPRRGVHATLGPERVPVPGHPWVPGFFIAATLAVALLMATRRPAEAGIGLLTAALGLPLYALARRRRSDPTES